MANERLHQRNSDNAIFYGVEYEGDTNLGRETIFVKGKPPLEVIKEAAFMKPGVPHIYFGAGALSDYDIDSVRYFVRDTRMSVTVETQSLKELTEFFHEPKVTIVATFMILGVRTELKAEEYFILDSFCRHAKLRAKFCTGNEVFITKLNSANWFDGYHNDEVLFYEEKK